LILKDATFIGSKGLRDLFDLTVEEQKSLEEFRDKILYPHIAAVHVMSHPSHESINSNKNIEIISSPLIY
jgi:phosphopantetheine adenylyltransferase